MMCLDCRLDFFVNIVTVITLIMSKLEFYAFDAFCGIAISIIILVSGVKLLLSSASQLINLPRSEEKAILSDMLLRYNLDGENSEVDFYFTEEKKAFVKTEIVLSEDEKESLISQAFDKTGIKVYLIK